MIELPAVLLDSSGTSLFRCRFRVKPGLLAHGATESQRKSETVAGSADYKTVSSCTKGLKAVAGDCIYSIAFANVGYRYT